MRLRAARDALLLGFYLQFAAPRPPRRNSLTLADRLAALPVQDMPLDRPVTIRWNARHVPFIEAENDRDLAVALGLVHAHLRLGQIEVMRRIAFGRASEMVGPVALDLDHTLRILDFGQAVPEIVRNLPDWTRTFLQGFVDGINYHLGSDAPLPLEFALFGLKREPWGIEDIVRLGRLMGVDITWLAWRQLLYARTQPGWSALWARLLAQGRPPTPVDGGSDPLGTGAIDVALGAASRSGSNSVAVAGVFGETGSAWIASDPHLGLSLPNTWLIAGMKSPGIHTVGLMLPGQPFVAIGRNPRIAWGGTNLHATSSALFDVSDIPEGDLSAREERIAVRWSKARTIRVRRCAIGPILSDSTFFKAANARLALRWVGHWASDEVTAMLDVNRAQDWGEFRRALDRFAVPGQNMLYADVAGDVGQAMATWAPAGLSPVPADFVSRDEDRGWDRFHTASALPARFRPESGFVASANDRPDGEIVVGHFFSARDRIERISALIRDGGPVGLRRLGALQQDVTVPSAAGLARRLAEAARAYGRAPTAKEARLLALLEGWDGAYDAASPAPAAFERMLYHFARSFYPRQTHDAYAAVWNLRELVEDDIAKAAPAQLGRPARHALALTARALAHRNWGDLHRLRLRHPLGALPWVGRHYRYFDLPASGGSETVMKTANGLAAGRHAVRYGANARHISNLGDPDENYFVLVGGQDGWFGSTSFDDQVALWRSGAFVKVPLDPDKAQALFPFVTQLRPAN